MLGHGSIEGMEKTIDVVGVGNALLDIIFEVDDAMLNALNLTKGHMHLITAEESNALFDRLEIDPTVIAPGGGVANAIAGVSVLGGRSALMAAVGNDAHGSLYSQKTAHDGVIALFAMRDSGRTGHAITFITPDGERTFATHLGAAIALRKDDVDHEMIAGSRILHLEGYLLEDAQLREAAEHARDIAREHGVQVSLDVSDPGVIGRAKDIIKQFIDGGVTIVFANEEEAEAFTGKRDREALEALGQNVETAIIKQGEKGSMITSGGLILKIEPHAVDVVNTNGAGDMYAAGILYGMSQGLPLAEAGAIASFAAAQVVASVGARLDKAAQEKVRGIAAESHNT